MLQEVQGLTASAAYGVVETYPSFRGLMRAYEQAEHRADPSVAENMLADCDIRSLKNGTASNRKVGKVSWTVPCSCANSYLRRSPKRSTTSCAEPTLCH